MPARVLKSADLDGASALRITAPVFAALNRIPNTLVKQTQSAPEDRPKLTKQRVLSRQAALVPAPAFQVPTFEDAPAFPLPDIQAEVEPEEADDIPEGPIWSKQIRALKNQWEAQWQQRMDEAVAQTQKAAYKQGFADAKAQLQGEYDEKRRSVERQFEQDKTALEAELARVTNAFAQDAAQLSAGFKAFFKDCEPLLAELAFEVAEALLDAPLPGDIKDVSMRSLSAAVDALGDDGPLLVSLHPVDLLRLQEAGLVEQLAAAHSGLSWDANVDLQHGDWIVQSPEAAVRHLRDEILNNLRQHLSPPPEQR